MGSSISKENNLSILHEKLKLIEPLLKKESVSEDDIVWKKIQESFIIPIDQKDYLETFVFKNISQTLFENNTTSGNIRSFILFFLFLISNQEKEIFISLSQSKAFFSEQKIQFKVLTSIGTIVKLIFKHYLSQFGVKDFIKSVEHTQLFDFMKKAKDDCESFQEKIQIIETNVRNFKLKSCENEYYFQNHFLLYILCCSNNYIDRENIKTNELSVFGQMFLKIPSFLVNSQRYAINIDSDIEFRNSIFFFQNMLMDILLILFFPDLELSNKTENSGNNEVSLFIVGFQLLSIMGLEQNTHVYCDDEVESTLVNYQFFQFLLKKIIIRNIGIENTSKTTSLFLLTCLLFNPPKMNLTIYHEWLNNTSDPRFLPDIPKYSITDSFVGSDSENTFLEFSSIQFFEQIYHSIVFENFLLTHNLSILLIYTLIHSNPHFTSYCLSRADLEKFILCLLEPIYLFSDNPLKVDINKISLLLSILLRLTTDKDICKVIHRTAIEHLPIWIKEESLGKIIYKDCKNVKYGEINMDISQNENSISIGNITLIVLLKILFLNYKTLKDIYVCNLICSTIINISINIENIHWYTAEKLVQYILFLNNQLYCALNTFSGNLNDLNFCNRSCCSVIILETLLHLFVQSLRNEYILSNIQLIYILLRMTFTSEIKKIYLLLKNCFKNYNLLVKQGNVDTFEVLFNQRPIGKSLLNILKLYDNFEFIFDSLTLDFTKLENFEHEDQMFAIIGVLKNSILSKNFHYSEIINKLELRRTKYNRNNEFEFEYILSIFMQEKLKIYSLKF